jgi:hypothetical protein
VAPGSTGMRVWRARRARRAPQRARRTGRQERQCVGDLGPRPRSVRIGQRPVDLDAGQQGAKGNGGSMRWPMRVGGTRGGWSKQKGGQGGAHKTEVAEEVHQVFRLAGPEPLVVLKVAQPLAKEQVRHEVEPGRRARQGPEQGATGAGRRSCDVHGCDNQGLANGPEQPHLPPRLPRVCGRQRLLGVVDSARRRCYDADVNEAWWRAGRGGPGRVRCRRVRCRGRYKRAG